MSKRCTCEIIMSTGPNPINEAEQDPFCMIHPVEQKVMAVWVEGWAAGTFDWPTDEELKRIVTIQNERLEANDV